MVSFHGAIAFQRKMPMPGHTAEERGQLKARLVAIIASLLVGASLMAVKFWAFRMTGSSAILSDALESIINVVASAFALISVLMAAKPPDDSHPYGHGKIEFFSAGFEGALIIIAAIGIFKTGSAHFFAPVPLPHLSSGLWLLLGTAAVNLALGIGLLRVGRRTESLVLVADGKHVLTDVYSSGGVFFGLVLVQFTGWYWLDGAIACVVGVSILITGIGLVRQSFSGLMDASDPDVIARVSRIIASRRRETWINVHRLRAWRSGNLVHIDFHLVLPRDFSLARAHDEVEGLEQIIEADFQGRASVLIHMDPCEDPACPVCTRQPCRIRNAPPGPEASGAFIRQGPGGDARD
jgi:cation diffusion facilitator family transporter